MISPLIPENIRSNWARTSGACATTQSPIATAGGTYTFDDFVSFLRGIPSADTGFQAPRLGSSSYRGFRETIAGTYMQDDFKVTQRLTLNLGLRWEVMRDPREVRSEEHTSELQSRLHLVCRLLLEKKKHTQIMH